MSEDFDPGSWDAGYNAAAIEHRTGYPCSRSYIGPNKEDFRNGMTAYRDEHDLPDDEFDLKGEYRMTNWRKIEILQEDGTWKEIDRSQLKKGDTFRMTEPTGERVKGHDESVAWLVTEDLKPVPPAGNFEVTCKAMMWRTTG